MNNISSKKKVFNYIGYVLIIVILIILDQFTKFLAVSKLKEQDPFVIWDGVFEFLYVENRGAAYGVLSGKLGFFIILTFIIIPLLIFGIYKIDKIINNLAEKVNVKAYSVLKLVIVILIAGAIGNFIDRMAYGYVVDFLYFKLIDFPVFNVADCYITLSTIALMIICIFWLKEKELDYIICAQKKWAKIDEKYAQKNKADENIEVTESANTEVKDED